jgi:hypothetical protein
MALIASLRYVVGEKLKGVIPGRNMANIALLNGNRPMNEFAFSNITMTLFGYTRFIGVTCGGKNCQ